MDFNEREKERKKKLRANACSKLNIMLNKQNMFNPQCIYHIEKNVQADNFWSIKVHRITEVAGREHKKKMFHTCTLNEMKTKQEKQNIL